MKEKRRYIYVSFYANRRRLGGGYVPEGSTREERNIVARKLGILNHNGICFEDRKHLFKTNKLKNGGIFITRLIPIK